MKQHKGNEHGLHFFPHGRAQDKMSLEPTPAYIQRSWTAGVMYVSIPEK